MRLTDYRALLVDCDGVLIDSDSGVWAALQGLLEGSAAVPARASVLALYHEALAALYPRFDELGFTGLLCFAHRKLAEGFNVRVSWEESLSFARSVQGWPLFEDAPGALLYLRKFYRLVVLCDRDAQDREGLCERLGLASEELLAPGAVNAWLDEQQIPQGQALSISVRVPANGLPQCSCLLRRGRKQVSQECPAEVCINSLADLVFQHQLSLRC